MKPGTKLVCIRQREWEKIGGVCENEKHPSFMDVVTLVDYKEWGILTYYELEGYDNVYVDINFVELHKYIKTNYTDGLIQNLKAIIKREYEGGKL